MANTKKLAWTCEHTSAPHYALGYCTPCYHKVTYPERRQAKLEASQRRRVSLKKPKKEQVPRAITNKQRHILFMEQAYAGYENKCKCCGETFWGYLQLDHVNNEGAEHRQTIGTGLAMYKWVIANNFPDSIQLLCANCHSAKTRRVKCPHRN